MVTGHYLSWQALHGVYNAGRDLTLADEQNPAYTYTRIPWNNKHNFRSRKRVQWSTGPQQKKVSITFWVCNRLFPCQVTGCVFTVLSKHWFNAGLQNLRLKYCKVTLLIRLFYQEFNHWPEKWKDHPAQLLGNFMFSLTKDNCFI